MKYKNYIFDLYGTLVDIMTDERQPELWERLALFYGYHGAFYAPDELHKAYLDVTDRLESGMRAAARPDGDGFFPEIKIEYVFRELFTAKGAECCGLDVLAGEFFRALSTRYIRLYKGARELLSLLRQGGAGVFLLSNAQRIFTEPEMKTLGICGCFDGIMLSSDFGVKKPDRRFFSALTDKYSLDPRECLMIGNDGTADTAGAKAAGMDALYISSNLSPRGDTAPGADYKWRGYDLAELARIIC